MTSCQEFLSDSYVVDDVSFGKKPENVVHENEVLPSDNPESVLQRLINHGSFKHIHCGLCDLLCCVVSLFIVSLISYYLISQFITLTPLILTSQLITHSTHNSHHSLHTHFTTHHFTSLTSLHFTSQLITLTPPSRSQQGRRLPLLHSQLSPLQPHGSAAQHHSLHPSRHLGRRRSRQQHHPSRIRQFQNPQVR